MKIIRRTKEKVKGYAREDAIRYIINLMEKNPDTYHLFMNEINAPEDIINLAGKDIDAYLLLTDEILDFDEMSEEEAEWKMVLLESLFEYTGKKKGL